MITYSATLAISRELVRFVARPLWAERRGRRTPEGQQGADLLLAGRCDGSRVLRNSGVLEVTRGGFRPGVRAWP